MSVCASLCVGRPVYVLHYLPTSHTPRHPLAQSNLEIPLLSSSGLGTFISKGSLPLGMLAATVKCTVVHWSFETGGHSTQDINSPHFYQIQLVAWHPLYYTLHTPHYTPLSPTIHMSVISFRIISHPYTTQGGAPSYPKHFGKHGVGYRAIPSKIRAISVSPVGVEPKLCPTYVFDFILVTLVKLHSLYLFM